jgi:hypothetical protein
MDSYWLLKQVVHIITTEFQGVKYSSYHCNVNPIYDETKIKQQSF